MVEPLRGSYSAHPTSQESLANQIIDGVEAARRSVQQLELETEWADAVTDLLGTTQWIVSDHFTRRARDVDSSAYFAVADPDMLDGVRSAVFALTVPGLEESSGFLEGLARLSRNLDYLVEGVGRMVPASDTRWPTRLATMRQAVGRVKRRIEELQEARLADVRHEVDSVAAHVKEAAGTVASTSLGDFFDSYATAQCRTANWLRLGVVLLLVLVASVAGFVVFEEQGGAIWTEELARIAVTSPLLLLAIYLSRESSRHRTAGDRARELEVRLKTVRAYTDELNDADRNEIRALLGKRVFGAGPDKTTDKEEVVVESIDPTSLKGAIEFIAGMNRATK